MADISNYLPFAKYNTALESDHTWTFSGTVTFSGTTNLAGVSLTDLTTTGNTVLGNAVTDTTGINGATTITSTSASALTVGANGATNPVLQVAASTASVATGLAIVGAAAAGGLAVSVISSGSNENLTINAKGSGTITIGNSSTGDVSISRSLVLTGSQRITSNGSAAFVVGPNGLTNPAFLIDASSGGSATGLTITSAAAASGLAIAVSSSGTNENVTISAKGTGTVSIGTTSTGNVQTGPSVHMKAMTAVPATAGAVAAGAPIILNSDAITIEATTDVPTHNRPIGSLCINLGGNSTSTRLYIATSASGAWAAITTAS